MKKFILFTAFIVSLTPLSQAQEDFYGVDVRDLKKFNTSHAEFSMRLIDRLNHNSCEFAGKCPSEVRWFQNGAQGPEGEIRNNRFVVSNERAETRKNTIFSVEIEKVTATISSIAGKSEDGFIYHLILFIHDETRYPDSKNLFFRRLSVVFKNSSISNPHLIQEIPLSKTHFSFYVDIMARKTVLQDSKFGIVKVFPIAVGALDIRNLPGQDLFAASLTPEFVNDARIYVGQPAGLHRARNDKGGMYKQRPFLGIVDDNGTTYRQIGWHFQMSEGELQAAFMTHGCFRTEDKNLYPMSEIVFASLQDFIPVKVVTSFLANKELQHLDRWTHPMPVANDFYYSVGYLEKTVFSEEYISKIRPGIAQLPQGSYLSDVEQYFWCKSHGQTIYNHSDSEQPGLRQYANWSTALDGYCLTKIVRNEAPVEPVLDFIFRETTILPEVKTIEPQYPIVMAGLCEVSLSDAQRIFSKYEHRQLTFRSYISNCGCDKLKKMLEVSLIRNGAGAILNTEQKFQMYDKYCN